MPVWSLVDIDRLFDFRFDAECHTPDFLALERRFEKLKSTPLQRLAVVSDGNHLSIAKEFCDSGVRYLKGEELSDFFIDDAAPTYIPRDVYDRIPRSHMIEGDVLLTIVGTIGNAGLVTDKYEELSGSCKLAIIRPKSVNGSFLAVYLASGLGQQQINRRIRGSVQPGLILPDLKQLPIPRVDSSVIAKVEALVTSAAEQKKRADLLYPEAEAELLDRLDWQTLRGVSTELSFLKDYQEIHTASRIDAEHFQPSNQRLRNKLRTVGAQRVGDICSFVKHGIQPEYKTNGTVPVITQRQFTMTGLNLDSVEHWTDEEFCVENPDFVLRRDDVLTYCVSAGEFLGRTNLFNSSAPAVAASFVTILRTTQVVPGYLALFLNSRPGFLQTNSLKRGTSPFYLYPRDLKTVLVFIPRDKGGRVESSWQAKLADKVQSATTAKIEAREKLASAKQLIDMALCGTASARQNHD